MSHLVKQGNVSEIPWLTKGFKKLDFIIVT